uniref:Uncharacterized protein n=1 Tax=Rhizophora mucronata TaxID=61149 RepID=A0A2P2KWS0_RHIMU
MVLLLQYLIVKCKLLHLHFKLIFVSSTDLYFAAEANNLLFQQVSLFSISVLFNELFQCPLLLIIISLSP